MARVVFANGSKQMAHNLDDLWERWCLKREALARQGIDDFVRPPKPQHLTMDAKTAFDLKQYAKERLADLNAARQRIKQHRWQRLTAEERAQEGAIDSEVLYWKQVVVRLTPLARTHYDMKVSKPAKMERRFETVDESEAMKGLRLRIINGQKTHNVLMAYCAYLQTVLFDLGIAAPNFDQWRTSEGYAIEPEPAQTDR